MDILYLVDRLENLIASSRRMPLVNQVIVKEADILNIVDQMRTSIPDEIKQARRVIQDKERILAQAQADASALLAKAREETERAMNQQGLLRAAEARSQDMLRQAEEKARDLARKAEENGEQLKIDADGYVVETLSNLRDHLTNIEMEVSRSILSIEKGLESFQVAGEDGSEEEEEEEGDEAEVFEQPADAGAPRRPSPIPRRASLANDTTGGPHYQP